MLGLAFDICRFSASNDKDCVYDRHREIIKKLKFITMIESGERINVNTCSTSPNTLFSSFYRSIFKESRQKTFQFLNDIMDRSFELIFLYKESNKVSDQISCVQIVDDIMNSLVGIRNLQSTYQSDRNFYCEMETLLGSIYSRLAELYENRHIRLTPVARHKLRNLLVGSPQVTLSTSSSASSLTPDLSPPSTTESSLVGTPEQPSFLHPNDKTSPVATPFHSPTLSAETPKEEFLLGTSLLTMLELNR